MGASVESGPTDSYCIHCYAESDVMLNRKNPACVFLMISHEPHLLKQQCRHESKIITSVKRGKFFRILLFFLPLSCKTFWHTGSAD